LSWGCVVLAVCLGCGQSYEGPRRAPVQGQVSLDGKAVSQGTIEFVPAVGTAGPTAGSRIIDGKFEISEAKGPVLGKYQVRISAFGPTGRKMTAGSQGPAGAMVDEIGEMLPSKYNTESTLEREIVAGENQLDFELTTKE
ncbi:MAG: hypothetical protein WD045_13155, partial [Pirellulaceae bacterium]